MSANDFCAGTFNENVPFSAVRIPEFLPRITTDTFFNGASFSSITVPVMVANFVCAVAEMVRMVSNKTSKTLIK